MFQISGRVSAVVRAVVGSLCLWIDGLRLQTTPAPWPARGRPCHIAGRSLRASCPSLTRSLRRWLSRLRFAILASLTNNAGSVARAAPS